MNNKGALFDTSVPLNLTMVMRMTQILVKFEPYDELDDIKDYCEQLELLFTVNVVATKEGGTFVKWIRCQNVLSLEDLMASETPLDCSMAQIKEELIKHFKPKPPVIAE